MHISTLEALKHYRTLRDKAIGAALEANFFVTFHGKPLGKTVLIAKDAAHFGPGISRDHASSVHKTFGGQI